MEADLMLLGRNVSKMMLETGAGPIQGRKVFSTQTGG